MSGLHAVIMAGGSGTRFWPASRTARPKQLLPLARGRALIEATFARLDGVVATDSIWVVTNREQAEGVRRALPQLRDDRLLVEPEARDTAPCVALAAAAVETADPGATMVVLPADHLIEPIERFQGLVRRGAAIAGDDRTLVTFGVRPHGPATGYGYIQPGRPLDDGAPRAYLVDRFREKPDLETAREYLATGRMLWNSGIFVWSYASILGAMRSGSPDLARQTVEMLAARRRGDAAGLEAAFRGCPRISIDYAVMERAQQVAVVEADIEWNDVGSFAALPTVAPPDADGNSTFLVHGARSVLVDAKDCVVYGDGPRTIALFGVEDLIVVQVDDAILVCPRSRAEELKALQPALRRKGCEDLL
jgi:mannose-1-phosphate guanylyltransferase